MNATTVIAAFLAVLLTLEIMHRRERKDLYNRLMSRDIHEYKATVEGKKTPPQESPHALAIKEWREMGRERRNE